MKVTVVAGQVEGEDGQVVRQERELRTPVDMLDVTVKAGQEWVRQVKSGY